jgi:anthranilate synthase component 1
MSLSPNLEDFLKLAEKNPGRLIPVTRRFLADGITPLSAFRRMPASSYAFLLESVERGERIGRYSFVGSAPELIFRGNVFPKPSYTLEKPGKKATEHTGDPLAALENYLQEHRSIAETGLPPIPPFCGGAVGYLGYDVVRLIEPRLNANPPRRAGIEGVPDMLVPIYRTILAFDHVLNTATIVHYASPAEDGGAKAAHSAAEKAIETVLKSLQQPAVEPLDEIVSPNGSEAPVRSNFERAAFLRAVEKAKEYIGAGDITQVVPSQRFSRSTRAHPFEVYRSLRAINPSPYMFYLQFGKLHLVGSSPEVLVRVQNGRITVRPIAGTRRRGATPEEDANLAKELLGDPKELAEHTMLLDLGRNDVGRVSEFGSVRVTEQMIIENYSHVMHIVSNVSGQMSAGSNIFEVLRSCMPAGTLSGSPKIRAMEIIDELEPDRRGPYGGAIGVMDFHGDLNTCIGIRTFVMLEKSRGEYDAHVQAGGGVVADSVPENEYEETVNKSKALLKALSLAEARIPHAKTQRRKE